MNRMAKKRSAALSPQQIRAIRTRLHLTQAAAAAKVGITQRAWAMLEAGDRVPSEPLAILIRLLARGKLD